MKSLRVLLLVVLAVLLPLRGALAGSAPCAEGPVDAARAIVASHVHTEAHTPGDRVDAVHAQHHPSSPDDGPSSAPADPCALCAATCSTTPFMGEPLSMVLPVATAGTSFPALVAPPPRHAAEGPERPPRSA